VSKKYLRYYINSSADLLSHRSPTPAPCISKGLNSIFLLRFSVGDPYKHSAHLTVNMASHQNSRALPEHGTFHIQGSLSSHVAHEPACRTVDHHNHAFDRLSITIPNDFQLQTAEPVPFRGLFHEAYLAQVPTQRKTHALSVCAYAEPSLTRTR
jgi:hypothetical protein